MVGISRFVPKWMQPSVNERGAGGCMQSHWLVVSSSACRSASLRVSPPSCSAMPARSSKKARQSFAAHSASSANVTCVTHVTEERTLRFSAVSGSLPVRHIAQIGTFDTCDRALRFRSAGCRHVRHASCSLRCDGIQAG
jgi:hypothetical protein